MAINDSALWISGGSNGYYELSSSEIIQNDEIIPGPDTDQEVLHFLDNYGDQYLGKTSVIANIRLT